MNKQTVEQAAKQFIGFPRDPLVDMNAYEKGFVYGSSFGSKWQKEQGIDWISVLIDLPPMTFIKPHVNKRESVRVLATDGHQIAYTYLSYDDSGVAIGWRSNALMPTHWAYCNLPKTD